LQGNTGFWQEKAAKSRTKWLRYAVFKWCCCIEASRRLGQYLLGNSGAILGFGPLAQSYPLSIKRAVKLPSMIRIWITMQTSR